MAIAFRSQTSAVFAQPGSGVVTAPAGIQNGDLLVLAVFIGCNDPAPPATPTPPTGFTAPTVTTGTAFPIEVDSGFAGALYVWTKEASSESGNYTYTYSTAQAGIGVESWMAAISGASGSPIEFCTTNKGTGTSTTVTGGTAANAGDAILLISFDYNDTNVGLTLPGTTPTFTNELTPPTSSNFTMGFGLMASAGATGNKVFTNNSTSGDPWGGVLMGLTAPGGPSALAAASRLASKASAGLTVAIPLHGVG